VKNEYTWLCLPIMQGYTDNKVGVRLHEQIRDKPILNFTTGGKTGGIKQKRPLAILLRAFSWAHLESNQGPADYESAALTD
jgi:hypothetical protein